MTARETATKAIKTGLAHQFGVVLYPDDGFRVQVLFRLKKGSKEYSYESRSFNGTNIKSVCAETAKRVKKMGANSGQIEQALDCFAHPKTTTKQGQTEAISGGIEGRQRRPSTLC